MSFIQHLKEDRRLCILRLLSELKGSANDSILHTGLEQLGHARIARKDVRSDISFLLDRGLIAVEWFETVMVATLLLRGEEVVQGRIEIDGVKKPSLTD